VISYRLVKLFDKLCKCDKPAFVPLIDGMGEKSGCKPCFTGAGGADPDHIPAFFHVIKAVIHVHDFLFVQFGLSAKRKCFNNEFFWDFGPVHPHLSGIFLFDLILFFNDILEQTHMRIIALLGG